MIYFFANGQYFTDAFLEVVKLFLLIDSIMYTFISKCFSFVIDVASSEFLLSDMVYQITDRMYIIVGVCALFLMSYALIKSLFDPNSAFKGKNSATNVIKNLLIAIALVALMPTIFQLLFRFQSIVVNNNIIGSIVLGNESKIVIKANKDDAGYEITPDNVGYKNYVKMASNKMSLSALNCFLYAQDDDAELTVSIDDIVGSIFSPLTIRDLGLHVYSEVFNAIKDTLNTETHSFRTVKNEIIISGNFLTINTLINYVGTGSNADGGAGTIRYMPIVSFIFGVIMVGFAVTFAVNVVIRVFKLFLLEVISPIASFSLIIPNSKIFNTWMKAVFKEYFDLFIRLFTFNLAILFFSHYDEILRGTTEVSSSFGLLNLFFIIGLLIFVNEAPKLVKDIFGIKDEKKGIKDRLMTGTVASVLGGAAGLVGGVAAGGINATRALVDKDAKGFGKVWNTAKGAAGGFAAGKAASKSKSVSDFTGAVGKNVSSATTARKKSNLYAKQHGGTLGGIIQGKASDAMNYITGLNPTEAYDAYIGQRFHGKIKDANDKMKESVENVKYKMGKADSINGVAFAQDQIIDVKDFKKRKEAAELAYTNALSGDSLALKRAISIEDYRANDYAINKLEVHQDIMDKLTLNSNATDRANLLELTEKYISNFKSGKDNSHIINELNKYDNTNSSQEVLDAIKNLIQSGDQSTVDSEYNVYRENIAEANNKIIAELAAEAKKAKDMSDAVTNYVINQKIKESGSTQNAFEDLVYEIKNAIPSSYINGKNFDIEATDSTGVKHKIDLQSDSFIELMRNDHEFMEDVVKKVKILQDKFESTDEGFRNAREKKRASEKKDK